MKSLLNVGGGSKAIPISPHFNGWQHHLLDIDPAGHPDVLLDARNLRTLPPATYDAVYCSHNLEHYHRHHVAQVLAGFHHILKPDGFAEIHVPDIAAVIHHVVQHNLDIDDQLYISPSGPILVRDVLYGYHVEIERSGHDFYAHKTAFTPKALAHVTLAAGFPVHALGSRSQFELGGYFFKQPPTPDLMKLLNLIPPSTN